MHTSAPPRLFDDGLIRRRLARAAREPVDFLLTHAADDLEARLSPVLRRFALVIDLGTPGGLAARRLRAAGRVEAAIALGLVAAGAQDVPTALADPQRQPLRAETADLIVSLLALHVIDDLPGALAQARRALRPDGLFIACLPGAGTLNELRTAFAIAESDILGGASPRVAPFADVRTLGDLMRRAGFALPVADTETLTARYAHPLALMRDLRGMGATNALLARSRTPLRRAVLARACAVYAERFADADGRVRASFELVWLSGWAPHDSQRAPLKPGSARMRLAQALGVAERPAGERAGGSEAQGENA